MRLWLATALVLALSTVFPGAALAADWPGVQGSARKAVRYVDVAYEEPAATASADDLEGADGVPANAPRKPTSTEAPASAPRKPASTAVEKAVPPVPPTATRPAAAGAQKVVPPVPLRASTAVEKVVPPVPPRAEKSAERPATPAKPGTLSHPAPPKRLPPTDPGYSTAEDQSPAARAGEPRAAKSPFVEEMLGSPPVPPGRDAALGEPPPQRASGPACATACCPGDAASCAQPAGWRLFDFPLLTDRRIEINGWLDQGITFSQYNPQDNFNGPVTFNDRANEYLMDQLYLSAERKTDTTCRPWDLGGRIDLLYGSDYRFTTAAGLEDSINQGARFYGLALPQMYLDAAYEEFTFRLGHFYTLLGYEVVPAPGNFFYSHSYTMQYGMPFTHTGALAIWNINPCWSVTAGLHRGWDRWNDNNQNLGFLGSVNWKSCDEKTTGAFAITVSNEDDQGLNTRTAYDLYFTRKLGPRATWVIEHLLGTETNAAGPNQGGAWFSVVNYFLYQLNDCWSVGLRYEWFDDQDGVRVTGIGDPNSPNPRGFVYPLPHALGPQPADWNELTLGVNYKPNGNILVRSELRWDWQVARAPGVQPAFNDRQSTSQFLWGTDLIVKF